MKTRGLFLSALLMGAFMAGCSNEEVMDIDNGKSLKKSDNYIAVNIVAPTNMSRGTEGDFMAGSEKENAVNAILTNIGDKKSVLMGDFNITPDNPLLIPIKEKMFDTAALFKQELLSFPSDNPNRKIDYIFTSRDIKVLDADIPVDIVSDHRPLITVIAD